MEVVLNGTKTAYTLDIDPDLVTVHDDGTLETPAPSMWQQGQPGDRYPLDTPSLLGIWLGGHDDWLQEMGIVVLSIVEEGRGRLTRCEAAAELAADTMSA